MKILKIISDILPVPAYSLIIICFFLPFLTVKCSTMELASVSGIDMAMGTDFKENVNDGELAAKLNDYRKMMGENTDEESMISENSEDEKSKPVVLLIIPFVLAFAGFILTFLKIQRKGIFQMIISGISFASLIIFGLTIKNSSELNTINTIGEGFITIHLGTAYYVSCLLFALILSFYGFEYYWRKNYPNETEV